MRITLNLAGAEALERLAEKLSRSSQALTEACEELARQVGTELDGTGILKGFLDSQLESIEHLIASLEETETETAKLIFATAQRIRDYVTRRNGTAGVETTRSVPKEIDPAPLMTSVLNSSIRKSNLPKTRGRWADPDQQGQSFWIPERSDQFSYTKPGDGKKVTTTYYGELLDKYGIEGIEYRDRFPVFETVTCRLPECCCIGTVTLDELPTDRGIAHRMADEAVTRNPQSPFFGKTPEEVHQFMVDHSLIWHEKEDRHTLMPVPADLHGAFRHTGGIGYEKQFGKLCIRVSAIAGKDLSRITLIRKSRAATYSRK